MLSEKRFKDFAYVCFNDAIDYAYNSEDAPKRPQRMVSPILPSNKNDINAMSMYVEKLKVWDSQKEKYNQELAEYNESCAKREVMIFEMIKELSGFYLYVPKEYQQNVLHAHYELNDGSWGEKLTTLEILVDVFKNVK